MQIYIQTVNNTQTNCALAII